MTISLHTIEAYVDNTPLNVIDATITLDEGWSPYVQGSISIPFNADLVDILDPRNTVRIKIYAQQSYGVSELLYVLSNTFGGGTIANVTTAWTGDTLADISEAYFAPYNASGINYNHRRGYDLTLRSRSINVEQATMTLDLSSDEALLQDYALVDTIPFEPGIYNVRTIVGNVLNRIGSVLQDGVTDGTIEPEASQWIPGQTAWDYVETLVQSVGLRLYCDEKRRWYLIEDNAINPGLIEFEATDTMTGASDTISRDDNLWFDAVVITYKWTDGLGVTQTAYDIAAEDPFSKVVHFEYDTPFPGIGAAQTILDRATNKGRTNDVSAVSDYRVTPATACNITLTDLPLQSGYVSAVTWNYPADEMTVKTRIQ